MASRWCSRGSCSVRFMLMMMMILLMINCASAQDDGIRLGGPTADNGGPGSLADSPGPVSGGSTADNGGPGSPADSPDLVSGETNERGLDVNNEDITVPTDTPKTTDLETFPNFPDPNPTAAAASVTEETDSNDIKIMSPSAAPTAETALAEAQLEASSAPERIENLSASQAIKLCEKLYTEKFIKLTFSLKKLPTEQHGKLRNASDSVLIEKISKALLIVNDTLDKPNDHSVKRSTLPGGRHSVTVQLQYAWIDDIAVKPIHHFNRKFGLALFNVTADSVPEFQLESSSILKKVPTVMCSIYPAIASCPNVDNNSERLKVRFKAALSLDMREKVMDNSITDEDLKTKFFTLLRLGVQKEDEYLVVNSSSVKPEMKYIKGRDNVQISAEVDLYYLKRQQRYTNHQLEYRFRKQMEHYMDSHSPEHSFFDSVYDVKFGVEPIVIPCTKFVKETFYDNMMHVMVQAIVSVDKLYANMQKIQKDTRSITEVSLMHEAALFRLDKQKVVTLNSLNLMLIEAVKAADKDNPNQVKLRFAFRINTIDKNAIMKNFHKFIQASKIFNNWIGPINKVDIEDYNIKTQPLYRIVRHKLPGYYPRSKRQLRLTIVMSNYIRRLCQRFMLGRVIMQAFHFTSKKFFKVEAQSMRVDDHLDINYCEFVAITEFNPDLDEQEIKVKFNLMSDADESFVWNNTLVKTELEQGMKFLFPRINFEVKDIKITSADIKFDSKSRFVEQKVQIASANALSNLYLKSLAAAVLKMKITDANSYKESTESMDTYRIDGAVTAQVINDRTMDSKRMYDLLLRYKVTGPAGNTWTGSKLKAFANRGKVKPKSDIEFKTYNMQQLQTAISSISRDNAICATLNVNQTIVYHVQLFELSHSQQEIWRAYNTSQLINKVKQLIRKSYEHTGLNVTDFGENHQHKLNVHASIRKTELKFTARYSLNYDGVGSSLPHIELTIENILKKFKSGVNHLKDDFHISKLSNNAQLLELLCNPTAAELQFKKKSVRKVWAMIKAKPTMKFRDRMFNSSIADYLKPWFKMLYLDYFDANNQTKTFIPDNTDFIISIDDDSDTVTLEHYLIKDNHDNTADNKHWDEKGFVDKFISAFTAFNNNTRVFSGDKFQADFEFTSLEPKRDPPMIVSPFMKNIVVSMRSAKTVLPCEKQFFLEAISETLKQYVLLNGSHSLNASPKEVSIGKLCVLNVTLAVKSKQLLDSYTWNPEHLMSAFQKLKRVDKTDVKIKVHDILDRCYYCNDRRMVFINMVGELKNARKDVDFLTTHNFIHKRRHLIIDHLIPALNSSGPGSSSEFLGRRRYRLNEMENSVFDFLRKGARERFSVLLTLQIHPPQSPWSEFHIQKALRGWMSKHSIDSAAIEEDIQVMILDPIEMSAYIPPPKRIVYQPNVLLTLDSADSEDTKIIKASLNTKHFKADVCDITPPNSDKIKCTITMKIQIPHLLTNSSVTKALLGEGAKNIQVTDTSVSLPPATCSHESRAVQFITLMHLFNTSKYSDLYNVSNAAMNDKLKPAGVFFVNQRVLSHYGGDVYAQFKQIHTQFRSNSKVGIMVIESKLRTVRRNFIWNEVADEIHSKIMQAENYKTKSNITYGYVADKVGFVYTVSIPSVKIFDHCVFRKQMRVLQTTSINLKPLDSEGEVFLKINKGSLSSVVTHLVQMVYKLKMSGEQIYEIVNSTVTIHNQKYRQSNYLNFTVSYTLTAYYHLNIGQNIVQVFTKRNLDRIVKAYGITGVNSHAINLLDFTVNGKNCSSELTKDRKTGIATASDETCYPILDKSQSAGLCDKHAAVKKLLIPLQHHLVVTINSSMPFYDQMLHHQNATQSIVQYILSTAFDKRMHRNATFWWDVAYSGIITVNETKSKSELRLQVKANYILKKESPSLTVPMQQINEIFNRNIKTVCQYLNTFVISYSKISKWDPKCDSNATSVSARPDLNVEPDIEATGVIEVKFFCKMPTNSQLEVMKNMVKRIVNTAVNETFKALHKSLVSIIKYQFIGNSSKFTVTALVDLGPVPVQLRKFRKQLIAAFIIKAKEQWKPLKLISVVLTPPSPLHHRRSRRSAAANIPQQEQVLKTIRDLLQGIVQRMIQQKSLQQCSEHGAKRQGWLHVRVTMQLPQTIQQVVQPNNTIGKPLLCDILHLHMNRTLHSMRSLKVEQVNLLHVSHTSLATALAADVLVQCLPDEVSIDDLKREFGKNWLDQRNNQIRLYEQLLSIEMQLQVNHQLKSGVLVHAYKAFVLKNYPTSVSNKLLKSKLHSIFNKVYDTTKQIQLRNSNLDTAIKSNQLHVYMYEDLSFWQSERSANHSQLQQQLLSVHLRDITKIADQFIKPYSIQHLFVRVLHQQPLHTKSKNSSSSSHTKTLMVQLPPEAARNGTVSQDLSFVYAAQSELNKIPQLRNEAVTVRSVPGPEFNGDKTGARLLIDLHGDHGDGKLFRQLVQSRWPKSQVQFLFSELPLHISMAKPKLTDCTFRIRQAAIDVTDQGQWRKQQSEINQLLTFWKNMILLIVHSNSSTESVRDVEVTISAGSTVKESKLHMQYTVSASRLLCSASKLSAYIADRFDLWNLQFPYSQIVVTDIAVTAHTAPKAAKPKPTVATQPTITMKAATAVSTAKAAATTTAATLTTTTTTTTTTTAATTVKTMSTTAAASGMSWSSSYILSVYLLAQSKDAIKDDSELKSKFKADNFLLNSITSEEVKTNNAGSHYKKMLLHFTILSNETDDTKGLQLATKMMNNRIANVLSPITYMHKLIYASRYKDTSLVLKNLNKSIHPTLVYFFTTNAANKKESEQEKDVNGAASILCIDYHYQPDRVYGNVKFNHKSAFPTIGLHVGNGRLIVCAKDYSYSDSPFYNFAASATESNSSQVIYREVKSRIQVKYDAVKVKNQNSLSKLFIKLYACDTARIALNLASSKISVPVCEVIDFTNNDKTHSATLVLKLKFRIMNQQNVTLDELSQNFNNGLNIFNNSFANKMPVKLLVFNISNSQVKTSGAAVARPPQALRQQQQHQQQQQAADIIGAVIAEPGFAVAATVTAVIAILVCIILSIILLCIYCRRRHSTGTAGARLSITGSCLRSDWQHSPLLDCDKQEQLARQHHHHHHHQQESLNSKPAASGFTNHALS